LRLPPRGITSRRIFNTTRDLFSQNQTPVLKK
jgi:hypothetical protein